MCGIAGFISQTNQDSIKHNITTMIKTLNHRGPDYNNTFIQGALALGHSRLAIIDTSSEANQPFLTPCHQYALIFNGEIYNYQELRQQLIQEGVNFRTVSDTEVLLYALITWGIDTALTKINGMFAFAFYNKQTNNLTIARDRLGIKPLYYSFIDGLFSFASELKALRTLPISFQINTNALQSFMRYSYIPAPETIYQNCFKLCAGQYLEISLNAPDNYRLQNYWQTKSFISSNKQPFDKTTFANLMKDAVKLRMQADVPLGAFLSGGIDSSLIVSLMAESSKDKINTFTIGFEEAQFNEANYAQEIAHHLGTNHHEQLISYKDAFDIIPKLASTYDEPFADSSQIPTMLISSLASNHVKVALSGDGGDELFGGYNRYFLTDKLAKISNSPSRFFIKPLIKLISKMNNKVFRLLNLPSQLKYKLEKLAHLLKDSSYSYKNLAPQYYNTNDIFKNVVYSNHIEQFIEHNLSLFEQAMLVDVLTYLPDDILVKVDRASMAHSLEVRTPLLDHRILQYAWSLEPHHKATGKLGKLPLRTLLSDYIPDTLMNRPKQGFSIPLGDWLRGGLKEWGEDLLHSQNLKNHSILKQDKILQKWYRHQTQQEELQYELWNVLMYLSWETTI